jgi:hypothetical protein
MIGIRAGRQRILVEYSAVFLSISRKIVIAA